jgi:hypothetical protein
MSTVQLHKLSQLYFEKVRVYRVTQAINTLSNGVKNDIKTTFDFEIFCHKKKEESIVVVIKKHKLTTTPAHENNYLELLEDMEQLTYPIAIEVSNYGDFIKMVGHEDWLANWEKKSQTVVGKFDGSEEVKDIYKKYNEIVKDEKTFIQNKFKEAFWNLFFSNPAFDKLTKTPSQTSIDWNIKSLGGLQCTGAIQRINKGASETITHFESIQKLSPAIITKIETMPSLENTNWGEQKVSLQIDTTFDLVFNRLKNKKATFEFKINNSFSYHETIAIDIIKVIDKK